ncbi:MAG: hypothetical protein K1X89_12310 [Myxococcaceae bacterium]|nr:hypothetical protein [Myxococcaceae bacterium]
MVAALLLGLALATDANPFLAQAQQHYRALEYEQAETLLAVLRQQPLPPADQLAVFDLLARIAIAKDDAGAARSHYRALLGVDPHWPGPVDAAPKVVEAFTQAKAAQFPRGLCTLDARRTGAGVEITLLDPYRQIATLELVTSPGTPRERTVPLELSLPITTAAASAVPLDVRARNKDGVVFRHVMLPGLEPEPLPPPVEVVAPQLAPSRGISPTLVVGVGAAVLAVAAVGLAAASAAESNQSFGATYASERRAHYDASKAIAVGAYASGAAAVAAGVGTLTLWFWAP